MIRRFVPVGGMADCSPTIMVLLVPSVIWPIRMPALPPVKMPPPEQMLVPGPFGSAVTCWELPAIPT